MNKDEMTGQEQSALARKNLNEMLSAVWKRRIREQEEYQKDFIERRKTGISEEEQKRRREQLQRDLQQMEVDLFDEYRRVEELRAKVQVLKGELEKMPDDKQLDLLARERVDQAMGLKGDEK